MYVRTYVRTCVHVTAAASTLAAPQATWCECPAVCEVTIGTDTEQLVLIN